MPRILTGITPSGTLHIGNYFGAMRPAIELQAGGDAYYFIADYHSMTVITGEDCVLGHASEFKNCLLLDGAQAPHFNYVGDSILGNGAHLGAGVICSNLRLDQGEVTVRLAARTIKTGLKKFGAVLGDRAEVGCNAVLNPGTLLGPRSLVMPGMAFGGVLPPAHLARTRQTVTTVARRD